MNKGTVKFFNNSPEKLFGFITADAGGEVFFHFNNGAEGNTRMPKKGDRLMYEVECGNRGPKAARWAFIDQKFEPSVLEWSGNAPVTSQCFAENLKNFGLEDFVVTGKIRVRNTALNEDTAVEVGPMRLSQMCGNVWETIKKRPGDSRGNFSIRVYREGAPIGFVDSDHRFHYAAAPDLRTALGWVMVSDLGPYKVLTLFHLDNEVKGLETVIRKAPVEGDEKAILSYFSGAFTSQLKRMFKYEITTRFSDGYMGVREMLWKIGTKAIHGKVLSYGAVLFLY